MTTRPLLLVVEDEPALRSLLERQLEQDYSLVFATCQREAFERLAGQGFDLMLLDRKLPLEPSGLDSDTSRGEEVLRQARTKEITRRGSPVLLPVVVMTAYGDTEAVPVTILKDLGANDYLGKPWKKEVLLKKLREALLGQGALVPVQAPSRMIEARQVRLSFELEKRIVWVEGKIKLQGARFLLLAALRKRYLEELGIKEDPAGFEGAPASFEGDPACFEGLTSQQLARALKIAKTESLRRRIYRFRQDMRTAFAEQLGRTIDNQDIIEALGEWRGYRLNPYTVRLVRPPSASPPKRRGS